MSHGVLVDTTRCIGCRSCQVSCKNENQLPAEETRYTGQDIGYTNPPSLSADTYTLVEFHEVDDEAAPGGLRFVFTKRQCMHCVEPACVSACPVTALSKSEHGGVTYEAGKCIGCRYCVWACPFGVPTADWDSLAPEIHKCDMCTDRIVGKVSSERLNDQPLTGEARRAFKDSYKKPACVKTCTTGALRYGPREELLEEARRRMAAEPERYTDHIFGEKEVGGTAYMYLSRVPFEELGFPTGLGERSYPSYTSTAMGIIPGAVIGMGAALGGIHLLARRKAEVRAQEGAAGAKSENGGPTS